MKVKFSFFLHRISHDLLRMRIVQPNGFCNLFFIVMYAKDTLPLPSIKGRESTVTAM